MSSFTKLIAALTSFTPIAFAGHADAGFFVSGADLQRQCGDRNGAGFHFCTAYVLGAFDGFDHVVGTVGILETETGRKVRFCLPNESTSKEVVTAVIKYLNANPGDLNLSAAVLTEYALREAFPCPL